MQGRKLTEEQKSILRQCLWDLNLTPEEFLDIIEGRLERRWPDRAFCVARLLTSVNWFKIVEIFPPEYLCTLWNDEVKKRVRSREIREGMDFVCRVLRKDTVSTSG
jgi:hypothetical protein